MKSFTTTKFSNHLSNLSSLNVTSICSGHARPLHKAKLIISVAGPTLSTGAQALWVKLLFHFLYLTNAELRGHFNQRWA
jgi:hypothetical protein